MYRRNGKPTSCEPCRLAKVRCNHATPVCARCQARGISDRCFYHPAPLTRATAKFRPYRVRRDGALPSASPSSSAETRNQATHSGPEKKPEGEEAGPDSSPSGYLGGSSALRLLPKFSPACASTTPVQIQNDASTQFTPIIQALKRLVTSSTRLEDALSRYYGGPRFTVIPRPLIVDPLLDFLRELRASQGQDPNFGAVFERVQDNLVKKLSPVSPHSTPLEFYQTFTSENIRLEFISVVFTISGVACHYTLSPAQDAEFSAEMYAASKACIQICENYNQVNELTAWARLMNVLLSSFLFGDASNALYHRFNEFVAELYVLGFHRLKSSPPDVPFFILETRNRIFAFAIIRDKSLATFLGRPPRVDNNFCDDAMPLNIDDDEIILQGSELQAVLQSAGDGGWRNISNGEYIRQSSFLRLRYQQAELQEKVLRLSLGNRGPLFPEKLRELYEAYHAALEEIPQQYRYHSSSWAIWGPQLCVKLLVVDLQYLYSRFQIERMLLQVGQVSITSLLETSMELLSGVLDFVQQQHSRPRAYEGYAWLFLYYGLPGAGTLATELYNSTISGTPLPTTTPRSQIIRDLSVLLAYFERKQLPVRPDFVVCTQISKVIGALLDDTLNSEPKLQCEQATQSGQLLDQVSSGAVENSHANAQSDGAFHEFNAIPPLPEQMTSQDFLSWFDELIWDDPAVNVESSNWM
ncbi:hypothetical protein BJY01DRAFT_232975 [Aspergillus pseudoustus]|uniref:Zn(2)-C6 fungal-type domain-containing protein n=1 Tax=Aspergillus pseudoustus TaxID=1810923 RepID=A0ABR4KG19_9EURO